MCYLKKNDNVFIIIYFPFSTANLTIYQRLFEKFDATSNSATVHHCMLPYKMVPVSLFIHEKCHPEKGLLSEVLTDATLHIALLEEALIKKILATTVY